MRSVLVVTSRPEEAQAVRSAFDRRFKVSHVSGTKAARALLEKSRYDVVFFDLELLVSCAEGAGVASALDLVKKSSPAMAIVVLTPTECIRQAVSLVRAGASDYLTYPISSEEAKLVVDTLSKALLQRSELDYLRDQFWKMEALDVVKTKNSGMTDVFRKIRSVSATKTTVLLTGETGTGKGVMARLVHQHSHRANAQFISVHCGAIPDTLLESELFGHEKGAFTGAIKKKLGKFEIAKGGTIFLDEIATISPSAQIKLLQVLQDATFSHVGGEETFETDARVIAATNASLKDMCEAGSFRKDLFYRLNVFPIEIPPLRERIEDLPQLVETLLQRLNRDLQKGIERLHPRVMEALAAYDWPGNIRELENLLERAYILENSKELTPESFPIELIQAHTATDVFTIDASQPLSRARQTAIEDFERHYLKALLVRHSGRVKRSAEAAGISTRQLHKLLTKYGIRKEDYKTGGQA